MLESKTILCSWDDKTYICSAKLSYPLKQCIQIQTAKYISFRSPCSHGGSLRLQFQEWSQWAIALLPQTGGTPVSGLCADASDYLVFGQSNNELVPQPLLTILQYQEPQDKAWTCELALFSLIV